MSRQAFDSSALGTVVRRHRASRGLPRLRQPCLLVALLIASTFFPTLIAIIAGASSLGRHTSTQPPALALPPGYPVVIDTSPTGVPRVAGPAPAPVPPPPPSRRSAGRGDDARANAAGPRSTATTGPTSPLPPCLADPRQCAGSSPAPGADPLISHTPSATPTPSPSPHGSPSASADPCQATSRCPHDPSDGPGTGPWVSPGTTVPVDPDASASISERQILDALNAAAKAGVIISIG